MDCGRGRLLPAATAVAGGGGGAMVVTTDVAVTDAAAAAPGGGMASVGAAARTHRSGYEYAALISRSWLLLAAVVLF